MRSIWSGALNVGLVNIPVSVVTAYSHKGVEFRLLHKKCKSRIGYGRHCPKCKAEVEWEDVVRAYEYRKDQYVIVDDKDLKKVDPKLSKMIAIEEFIDAGKLDPIFVKNVYYLTPGANAGRAYFLLVDIMAGAGKVALAEMIMRDKQQLVAVRSTGKALQLIDLHYADEIVNQDKIGLPARHAPAKSEVRLAQRVIDTLSSPFKPERYKDEFEEKLKKYVAKKAKGRKIVVPKISVRPTISDLTKALEKSVRKGRK